jgi:hypothetical protein
LLAAAGERQGQRGRGASQGNPGPVPEPPAFATLNGTMIRQLEMIDSGDMAPNDPQNRAFFVACNDLHGRIASWMAMNGKDLPDLNALLAKNNLKAVTLAKPSDLAMPVCAAESRHKTDMRIRLANPATRAERDGHLRNTRGRTAGNRALARGHRRRRRAAIRS